jgi:hypothetical protein
MHGATVKIMLISVFSIDLTLSSEIMVFVEKNFSARPVGP